MSPFTALLSLTDSFSFVISLCVIGITLCIYAIKVETTGFSEKKKTGVAPRIHICDVNDSMSCTFVLTSEYSHMMKMVFGLAENSILNHSNAEYGLVFYIGLLIFHFYPFTLMPLHSWIFLLGTTGSVAASCVLAWILKYRLHNFCMICVCMYIINVLLFISSLRRIFYA